MGIEKRKLKIVWGAFMILIYCGMAFLLIFSNLFNIQPGIRIAIGVLFLIYGVLRGYRIWNDATDK